MSHTAPRLRTMHSAVVKITIFLSICFCGVTHAVELHVSPQGDDTWSGKLVSANAPQTDGPFRTLEKAQSTLRSLKASGQLVAPVTVTIAEGMYRLEAPLAFDVRDSGSDQQPIVWRGAANANVVISGGRAIQTCQKNGGQWRCHVEGLGLDTIAKQESSRITGNAPSFALYVNETRMHLARWPNTGWAYIKQPLSERRSFTYFQKAGLTATTFQNAQVYIWAGNDWHDQYIGIASLNPASNTITLTDNTNYALESGRRFKIRNIESALDAAGEWYYDASTQQLHFMLDAAVTPATVVASRLPHIVTLNGAHHITLEGLSFRHATNSGIHLRQSHHIRLVEVEVRNVDGIGIESHEGQHIAIHQAHVHHTGRGGVLLSGGDRATLHRSENRVDNTYLHHVGEILAMQSPAIHVRGVGATVSHSLIEYTPGRGIEIEGNEHVVEKTDLHHLCELAGDCGAIYTGRDWTYRGNVIRHNKIHDLFGFGLRNVDVENGIVTYGPRGARGVYLDDAGSGFVVTGNLFQMAGDMAIQIGGGRDNQIANNVIITNEWAIWIDHRWPAYNWAVFRQRLAESPYQNSIWRARYPALAQAMLNDTWPEGNRIERNIVVSTNEFSSSPLRYFLPVESSVIQNNLMCNAKSIFKVDYDLLDRGIKKDGKLWDEWVSEGVERNSILSDPCLEIEWEQIQTSKAEDMATIGFEMLPQDIGRQDRSPDVALSPLDLTPPAAPSNFRAQPIF